MGQSGPQAQQIETMAMGKGKRIKTKDVSDQRREGLRALALEFGN